MLRHPETVGRYRIVSVIGHGGMGTVYRASDPHLDRIVAVKILRDGMRPELRRRFIREAQSAGRLSHPSIVTVYDYGEQDGAPYLVMEYVDGTTLANFLENGPTEEVSVGQRLRWLEDVCAGLEHSHAAGIIHRDIKPANLMLDRRGSVRILDFGIARLADSSLTGTAAQLGTIPYMSPEQIRGDEPDPRTDIYSLGVVGYEILTFRHAFDGTNTAVVMQRILQAERVPLRDLLPWLNPAIVSVVDTAMHPDRAQRYQDAKSFRQALEAVRSRVPHGAEPPTVVIPRSHLDETLVYHPGRADASPPATRRLDSAPEPQGQPPPEVDERRPRKRASLWQYAIVSAGVLMVVAAIAARAVRNEESPVTAPARISGADVKLPPPPAPEEPTRIVNEPPNRPEEPRRSPGANTPPVSPEEVRLLVQSGIAAYGDGKFDEALNYFDRALKLDPANREARDARTRAATARRALIQNTIHRSLARARQRYASTTSLADYEEALKDVEYVLRLDPNHKEAADLATKIRTARDAEQKRMKVR